MVATKLTIPKGTSSGWGSDKTFKELRSGFEKEVEKIFDSNLSEDWRYFIKFTWTSEFFCLEAKTGAYSTTKIKSYKKGNDFVLKQETIATLKNQIEATKTKNNKDEIHKENYKALLKLCKDAFKIKEGVAELDFNSLEVRVEYFTGENKWSGTAISCTIQRDGSITEPSRHYAKSVKTISEANEFIEDTKPLCEKLLSIASAIKNNLPKEYFING